MDLDLNRDYQIWIKVCNLVKGCNKDKFDKVLVFKIKGIVQVFYMVFMLFFLVYILINYFNNYSEIIFLVMCVIFIFFYFLVVGLIMNYVN